MPKFTLDQVKQYYNQKNKTKQTLHNGLEGETPPENLNDTNDVQNTSSDHMIETQMEDNHPITNQENSVMNGDENTTQELEDEEFGEETCEPTNNNSNWQLRSNNLASDNDSISEKTPSEIIDQNDYQSDEYEVPTKISENEKSQKQQALSLLKHKMTNMRKSRQKTFEEGGEVELDCIFDFDPKTDKYKCVFKDSRHIKLIDKKDLVGAPRMIAQFERIQEFYKGNPPAKIKTRDGFLQVLDEILIKCGQQSDDIGCFSKNVVKKILKRKRLSSKILI